MAILIKQDLRYIHDKKNASFQTDEDDFHVRFKLF